MSSLFKKLDFIGPRFSFESNSSYQHQTISGSIFSLLTFLAAFIIAIMFGREVYERKIPFSNVSNEFTDNSEILLKNFPIYFSVSGVDGSEVPLSDYIDPMIEYTVIDQNSKSYYTNQIPLTVCDWNNYKNYTNMLQNLRANDSRTYYCIGFNDTLGFKNDLGSADSSHIRVNFISCGVLFPRKCADELKIRNLIVLTSIIDSYVDVTDYKEPVKYYERRIAQPILYGMMKFIYISVTNDIFIGDNGWMLEDMQTLEYKKISLINNDMTIVKDGQPMNFFTAIFDSPKLRVKSTRSYMKVQELFAKVGGIANAFIIIITFLTQDYLRFKYLVFISSSTIDNNSSICKPDNSNLPKRDSNKQPQSDLVKLNDNSSILNINAADKKLNINNKDSTHGMSMKGLTKGINKTKINNKLEDGEQISRVSKFNVSEMSSNNNRLIVSSKNNILDVNRKPSVVHENSLKNMISNILPTYKVLQKIKTFELSKEEMSYKTYIISYLCCQKDKKRKFEYELGKAKSIMDIKLFGKFIYSNYLVR
jgi:hypothetical protein